MNLISFKLFPNFEEDAIWLFELARYNDVIVGIITTFEATLPTK